MSTRSRSTSGSRRTNSKPSTAGETGEPDHKPSEPSSAAASLQMETWPIERLIPYEANPRKNEAVVDQMVASFGEFGFRIPIVARSDGLVVDGHLRLKAAQRMGLTEVPVVLADGLSEAQIKAFRITANQSANWAAWDDELLSRELRALEEMDFDLSLIGFETRELDRLLAGIGEKDEGEEVPEPPVNPVSQLGDIWILGDQRLACGSSTDAETVAQLLAGTTPHLMVTDPPYGVEYDPSWRANTQRSDGKRLSTGKVAMGKVMNDDRADWREAWELFPGDVAYVWHGGLHAQTVAESLTASGFELRSQIIWDKGHAPISRSNYHWQHEPCWYVVRKGRTAHYNGDRKQTTVWQIANNDGANRDREEASSHGTQKPIECMRRPIENNSKRGEAVYEPFSGSFTTGIACELTGRRCYAVELNPAYVDVGVLRWEKLTGGAAVLESTGQTFAEVQAERVPVTESA